jgi:ABC-type Zn uptake system ZnuABC Zn-binding protein ZnuA
MKVFIVIIYWMGWLAATLGAAPLRVVTLHSVLTEIVTEVGGAEVTTTCLLRPGDDPHTFNPPPAEVRTLAQADLIVASGFGLEPFLDKLVANSGTKAQLVAVSSVIKDVVPSSGARSGGHAQGEVDPLSCATGSRSCGQPRRQRFRPAPPPISRASMSSPLGRKPKSRSLRPPAGNS